MRSRIHQPKNQQQNPQEKLHVIQPQQKKKNPQAIKRQQKEQLQKLLCILHNYKDLKDLPMSATTAFDSPEKLWRDSPCTLKNASPKISMDRIERFKIGSIYHRDKLNEQKKVFTESEKPELLLKNFKRQIEEAGNSRSKYSKSKSKSLNSKRTDRSSSNSIGIDSLRNTTSLSKYQKSNKVYEVPPKLQLKRDRYGNRSNYVGQYNLSEIVDRINSSKANFTSSRRMDLGLPLNYYPGPGRYFQQCPAIYDRKFSSALNKLGTSEMQKQIKTERKLSQVAGHHAKLLAS